jgi:hypothetical protein
MSDEDMGDRFSGLRLILGVIVFGLLLLVAMGIWSQ